MRTIDTMGRRHIVRQEFFVAPVATMSFVIALDVRLGLLSGRLPILHENTPPFAGFTTLGCLMIALRNLPLA